MLCIELETEVKINPEVKGEIDMILKLAWKTSSMGFGAGNID